MKDRPEPIVNGCQLRRFTGILLSCLLQLSDQSFIVSMVKGEKIVIFSGWPLLWVTSVMNKI
jgi:hypothetical protein